MAQLSIKETIKYTFSAYKKHFVVLMIASVVMAVATLCFGLFQDYLATTFHMLKSGDAAVITEQFGQQGALAEIVNRLKAVPVYAYLLLLVSYLMGAFVTSYLFLGLTRITLAIKDRDRSSVVLLLAPSFTQTMRFIAALAFLTLCVIGVFMVGGGLVGLSYWLVAKLVGVEIARIFALVQAVGGIIFAGYYYSPYSFLMVSFADSDEISVRAALKKCREVADGSYGKIILTAGSLILLILPMALVPTVLLGFIGSYLSVPVMTFILSVFVMGTTYPIITLGVSSMYRTLKPVK